MSFELFVALRYLKSRRAGLFTMVTTVISIGGVSIGVAALIVILSVMNGFQTDIRKKIVGAQAHITIFAKMEGDKLSRLESVLADQPQVEATSPFVLGQAIITFDERSTGIVLKGVDPAQEFLVNDLAKNLTSGSWSDLTGSGLPGIVLGEELAGILGVFLGEDIILVSPQSIATPMGLVPALKKYRVVGTLKTGYYEYDSATAYSTLASAAKFFRTPGGISGVQARLTRLKDSDEVSARLQEALGFGFTVRSFTQMNRTLFAALRLEKYVMFIIVVTVAMFVLITFYLNYAFAGP